jgi:hypothetical protein
VSQAPFQVVGSKPKILSYQVVPASLPLREPRRQGCTLSMVSTQVLAVQAASCFLMRVVRGPAFAWILPGIALFWGLQTAASNLGIASDSTRPGDLYYEVAFVSALVAGAVGLRVLVRHPWPWPAVDRLVRVSAESLFLLVLAGSILAVAWIPALARSAPLPWGRAAATVIHVIALAQLVSRLPMVVGLHSLLLVALVWWIPAIHDGGGGVTNQLAAFLAAPGDGPMQVPRPADMAPALAFCVSAWLLTPKTPRP